MTIRKTDPVERVDMLLAQAERFLGRALAGEAAARAKQVMAYCDRESVRHPGLAETLATRKLVAEAMIERLGRAGHLRVDEDDASHPEAWA